MEPAENSAGSVETKKGISTANPSYVSGGLPPCLCIYHTTGFLNCKFLPNKKLLLMAAVLNLSQTSFTS